MPTYQYVCTECATDLEAVQSFQDPPRTECPTCGGRLRKRFGAVGVVFKGSGFYRNDSRKGSAPAESDGGGEKKADKGEKAGATASAGASGSSDAGSASGSPSGSSGSGNGSTAAQSGGGSSGSGSSSGGPSTGGSSSSGSKDSPKGAARPSPSAA